jgi:hypothetical protein
MIVCDPSLLFSTVHERSQKLWFAIVDKTGIDTRSSARKLIGLALLSLNQVELDFDDIDNLIDYFQDQSIKKDDIESMKCVGSRRASQKSC